MTKLVTWNCNMAFRRKKKQLLQADPDILVVQECENPEAKGDWREFSDWVWVGENGHKGLGIFARNGISLESASIDGRGGRFTLPVRTDTSMDVIGVWAMNDDRNPENRYIGQVYTTVNDYRSFIDSNTVIAGDFNWNIVWDDSPKSRLCGNFSETVELLSDCGLRSSYHELQGVSFGEETDPTFFMHKKRRKSYHIDYIFAPDRILNSVANISVREYDDWIDASDHMPIVIDF